MISFIATAAGVAVAVGILLGATAYGAAVSALTAWVAQVILTWFAPQFAIGFAPLFGIVLVLDLFNLQQHHATETTEDKWMLAAARLLAPLVTLGVAWLVRVVM